MTSRFDQDTAITQVGEGRFTATVADGWGVPNDGPPNGGYLLAIVLRAMGACTDHPHVTTATAHFLRPGRPGPVEVEVDVAKVGRRLSTLTARLCQDDRVSMQVVGAFSDLSVDGPSTNLRPPLDLPPPSDCLGPEDAASLGYEMPGVAQRMDERLVRDDVGFAVGRPGRHGLMRGWGAFEDGRPMDSLGLAVLCDAFPPAVFNAGLPIAWAPTVELTLHVRHPGPLEGHLAGHFQSLWATNGVIEEDGIIETADGTPVALSRQLLLAPRPQHDERNGEQHGERA